MGGARRFAVRVAPGLALQLAELKGAAETVKAKRQLYRCLSRLAQDFLPDHACHETHLLSGPLRGVVYRAKQGRLRIFYTASIERGLVILLDVGNRKDGDKNDAYRVLERRIRGGDFDEQFRECGHQRPAL